MSAKLLYSMSDDNQNLKKQMGCMNGLLQFFDPHHFINNRAINSPSNRRISPDENKQQEKTVDNATKRSKEKHLNVTKEMQVNPLESSRLSISSTGSTNMSSSEYNWTSKPEHSPFAETVGMERQSWDYHPNQSHSSPRLPSSPAKTSNNVRKKHTTREALPLCASPINTATREVERYDLKQMDSPRLSHASRPDSPRLSALNESFRSINSNHSAPVGTPRSKDFARLSYDGRDTRDNHISSLKLRDLPRLSLDSKQRAIKVFACGSKDDLLLKDLKIKMCGSNKNQNDPQEPASCRTPSNIVAKLMGLETLPDETPSNSQIDHDGCNSIFRNSDLFSRSSRTIDEGKVDRILHSPRSKCKESRASRLDNPKSGQTASTNEEAHSEPQNHPLTVYGAIEKRLADLDFQKSGKDLRALKQILESMHKENKKLEIRKENRSLHCASPTSNNSSFHISHRQGSKKVAPPTSKGSRSVNIKSTEEKLSTALVKGSETTKAVPDIPLTSLQRLPIVQPVSGTKDFVQKKAEKDLRETHHIRNKYSGERTPRPIRTSKAPEHMSKENVTSSARISHTRSPPATTSGSRVKQSQQAMGFLSQNRKLPHNSSLMKESNDQPCGFRNESTHQSKQRNTKSLLSQNTKSMVSHIHRVMEYAGESCMKSETQQEVSGNKTPRRTQGDMGLEELAVTVREQPSPVSVLDANLFEEETPSPVKKKPTAFRDFETNATYTEAEWITTDPIYSPHSTRPGFSYDIDYQKLENFEDSGPSVWNLNPDQGENLSNASPLDKDENLEKLYVSEILLASGFPDHLNYTMADQPFFQSQEIINPNLFFVLEQTIESSFVTDKRANSKANRITRTNERHRRRLLFDAVNEILSQKLFSQPRLLLKKQSELTKNGPKFPLEIFKEIDQLQPINLPHGLDDEDDFLTTIIGKDLTQTSPNWTDASCEIPALALDIERLIFKDLIVELVQN